MLAKFLPKQKSFFPLFNEAAEVMVKAAEEFVLLVNHLDTASVHVRAIDRHEHEGDKVALLTYELLHKTFITPFDRHDIHNLVTQLDDGLDRMHRVAQRIMLYQFHELPVELVKMAQLNLEVVKLIRTAVEQLSSLKNQTLILDIGMKINQLENDAEAMLLKGLEKLFQHETDFKRLLQLKEIYEQTKGIINASQDIANLIKSIMLEYA